MLWSSCAGEQLACEFLLSKNYWQQNTHERVIVITHQTETYSQDVQKHLKVSLHDATVVSAEVVNGSK